MSAPQSPPLALDANEPGLVGQTVVVIGASAGIGSIRPDEHHDSAEVSPSRIAYLVSSAMVRRFTFSMICRRCVSTVATAIWRTTAISFEDFPSAMSCRTSRSRRLSRLSDPCEGSARNA